MTSLWSRNVVYRVTHTCTCVLAHAHICYISVLPSTLSCPDLHNSPRDNMPTLNIILLLFVKIIRMIQKATNTPVYMHVDLQAHMHLASVHVCLYMYLCISVLCSRDHQN